MLCKLVLYSRPDARETLAFFSIDMHSLVVCQIKRSREFRESLLVTLDRSYEEPRRLREVREKFHDEEERSQTFAASPLRHLPPASSKSTPAVFLTQHSSSGGRYMTYLLSTHLRWSVASIMSILDRSLGGGHPPITVPGENALAFS